MVMSKASIKGLPNKPSMNVSTNGSDVLLTVAKTKALLAAKHRDVTDIEA